MKQRQFRRTNIRLPLDTYTRPHVVSVTIATSDRHTAFAGTNWANVCLRDLREAATRHAIAIYAYCFMPDHLHLLAQSTGGQSVVAFVKDFKQPSGFWYKRSTGRPLWQASYYDHFARTDEDLVSAARYMFENPVRAGLVARAEAYPFSGSFVWERSVVVEA